MDTINQEASRASNTVVSAVSNGASRASGTEVDAIVVVGAEPKTDGLDGMAALVTEDVYDNLKVFKT